MKKIFVFVILSVAASCSNQSDLPFGSDELDFDSKMWQSDSSLTWDDDLVTIRQKMLNDLVTNILPGKTKNEIETLLGESLDTNYFASIEKDFIYYMGPERNSFIRIDSEWLLIWIDEKGNFEKYKLVND